ncbi:MAG: Nif11-like leader peptide family RiPP precursor, partial [Eubacteriales bacterium]|nr:Nif11-like leader peptide family RiPP precursor [Eubacteriales bacterium]
FAEKILSQTEKEKVIEIAKGEGIDLTMEDIDEINEVLTKALQTKKEGELSEEELESVAGGVIFETTMIVSETLKTTPSIVTISVINISEAVVSALSAKK